jgi:hypothetical protein
MSKNECVEKYQGQPLVVATEKAFGLSPIVGFGVVSDSICIGYNTECRLTSFIFLFFRFGVCTITRYIQENNERDDIEMEGL